MSADTNAVSISVISAVRNVLSHPTWKKFCTIFLNSSGKESKPMPHPNLRSSQVHSLCENKGQLLRTELSNTDVAALSLCSPIMLTS